MSRILIQHFGTSNPSPRYIKSVATAFKDGLYNWSDGSPSSTISYGDGKWGNLAAVVAAIVLDREATSVVLDDDPTSGSLRQPINKVISFMKAMEYKKSDATKLNYPMISGISGKIGQMAHESETVFSFFRPDYYPNGSFGRANLFAPETQILNDDTISGFANGLYSLIKDGLIRWNGGFGHSLNDEPSGWLTYYPDSNMTSPEQVIEELSTLLTSGRLSQKNKELIIEKYNSTKHDKDEVTALKVAQQLISTTPEFHSTNTYYPTNEVRETENSSSESKEPYKAIVFVALFGGMDSFYMLSPHSSCDVYSGMFLGHGIHRMYLHIYLFIYQSPLLWLFF